MNQEEISKELIETSARAKSNTKRLDKIEERQDEADKLVAAMTALQTEQTNIKEDVQEIKDDVKSLTLKPARRWEQVSVATVIAVITALVGFLMGKLF